MRIAATGYGRRVALDLDPADLGAVRAVLPWWWHDEDPDVTDAAVFAVPDAASARKVVADLERDVAEHAEGFVFVHAAAVAFGDRALLLPGRSLAGKSTLTAALLAAGARYLSDEYAVLDPAGRVHAYPRPLTLRTPAGRDRQPVPHVQQPLHVAAVALVQHATGAAWQTTALPPGETVLALLVHTVCARSRPAEALQAVAAVADRAVAVTGHRGEATDAVPHLRELVDRGR